MARPKAKYAVFQLILCAFSCAVLAQHTQKSTPQSRGEPSAHLVEVTSPRLLNVDEGMAIIGASLEARQTLHPHGDCSHLVHTIYQQAGFSYRYADSNDLYDGVPEFRQVMRPQAGDLAVWRGHAAIIVNPAQHTFFSATRSGLRVESYDLAYWRHRGTPRFFRYVKSASADSLAVTRTAASATNPRNFGSRTPDTAPRASNDPSTDDELDKLSTPDNLPRPPVLHSLQPTSQQLNETLSRYFRDTEEPLRSRELATSSQPIVVFDRITVRDVRIRRDQAWAEVKIDGLCTLVAAHATAKKRSEQQRWRLIPKDASTWELEFPPHTSYLQRDVAVRILAHQLAALADHSPEAGDSSKEQAQLARMLDMLLEK